MIADGSLFYFNCFIFIFHWKLSDKENKKCLLVNLAKTLNRQFSDYLFFFSDLNDHLFLSIRQIKIGYIRLQKYFFGNVTICEGTTGNMSGPAVAFLRARNFLMDIYVIYYFDQGYKMCVLDYEFHILDNAFLLHRYNKH